ncbi:ribosome maturation factor RimP [Lactococcus hodotermopsidis]|uniref:Ribosome maturation factor RimP n=1 Tax=Pseudolactococcus hodotermopsidis TaxID=2709157 RepID=A0A6A0BCQ3_9LACT|nr:ribosome maturation factor RimP [Lactococcus hodotermopsidis]GFH43180.1 ribosome maturation factor RimP [Lactococcus hodotermopsidis]
MSTTIIETVLAHLDGKLPAPFELVDVEWSKLGTDQVLSVLVDKPDGITLQDTADLSEIISPELDKITPDPFPSAYMLEVASPGAERPLKKVADFEAHIGDYIFVKLYQKLEGEKEFVGDLVAFADNVVTLSYLDKTRQKTVEIDFSNIAKAQTQVKI